MMFLLWNDNNKEKKKKKKDLYNQGETELESIEM